ncbi:hypothetical protein SLA2020_280710 [Shorea laevis]
MAFSWIHRITFITSTSFQHRWLALRELSRIDAGNYNIAFKSFHHRGLALRESSRTDAVDYNIRGLALH